MCTLNHEPVQRNCENMSDFWKALDDKYGNNIDISLEIMSELTNFKYTTKFTTKPFLELYNKYNHSKQDLQQVDKLSELNNMPTLELVSAKLPDEIL